MRAKLQAALFAATRLTKPLARLTARRGYFRPPDLASIAPRRVALIACHWLGDTFWATQVVPALRERFAQAELFAITKPAWTDLFAGLIAPDHVLTAPRVVSDRRREPAHWPAIRRRARDLRDLAFDLAIDLTGNRYSAYFTFALRPRTSVGFDGGELGWLYSHRVADAERSRRHLCERPFRVIEPLLAGTDRPFAHALPLRPPDATRDAAELRRELGLGNGPCFVLAPGAGWPEKQWPVDRFAAVGSLLAGSGCELAVVGSAAQDTLCRAVAAEAPRAVVCAGRPLGEVVALLAGAAGALANDSGIAHLAAALGRRTAAVFTGVTDPAVCGPLGPPGTVRIFQADATPEQVADHLLAT